MSVYRVSYDIYDTLGKPDGVCDVCGAPAKRMGWLGNRHSYWRMCTASSRTADDDILGACDLPTVDKARRRLAVEADR